MTSEPQVDRADHDERHDHDDEGYRGPATLTIDGVDHDVTVRLVGHFQPIDGWFHWYGRADVDAALEATLGGRKRPARVTTPDGAADGEVSDPDPWGRYRITGTSTPPFRAARSTQGSTPTGEPPRGTRDTVPGPDDGTDATDGGDTEREG